MARVRATCEQCGDIELPISAVAVRICREDHDGVYLFTCAECGTAHEKTASRRTLDLLIASGTDVTYWSVPVETLVVTGLGPLTHDELLDFHRVVEDEAAIAKAFEALIEEHSQ